MSWMKINPRSMKRALSTVANSLAVFAGLLILWQLVLLIFRVPAYMLPSPWAVARSVVSRAPTLATAFTITGEEALGGLMASVVAGAAIALVLLINPAARTNPQSWATSKLPLGTFLCVGGIVSSLWGQPILAAYFRWAGF